MRKKIGYILLYCSVLLAIWVGVVYRVMNPDMTEMRLFLSQWKLILLTFALMGGGAYLSKIWDR